MAGFLKNLTGALASGLGGAAKAAGPLAPAAFLAAPFLGAALTGGLAAGGAAGGAGGGAGPLSFSSLGGPAALEVGGLAPAAFSAGAGAAPTMGPLASLAPNVSNAFSFSNLGGPSTLEAGGTAPAAFSLPETAAPTLGPLKSLTGAGLAAGGPGVPGIAKSASSLSLAPSVSSLGGVGAPAAAPSGGFLSSLTNFVKNNPLLTSGGLSLGSNLIGSTSQANILEDLNEANQEAYEEYLNVINPPKSVLEQRFADRSRQIKTSASQARKGLASTLAARGIRGKGVASPLGRFESQVVQPALSTARNQIFGQYNVPGAPGPASFAPSGGQLFGSNVGQLGSFLTAAQLAKLLTT